MKLLKKYKLKEELLRIGSTHQADYDLLKSKDFLSSSAIIRREKKTWWKACKDTFAERRIANFPKRRIPKNRKL
ncbi:hypothetical protein [Metabacillus sp. RGM 3146]|uniref:hypothetical protein n=1 Tax=Metabacillus sp. RGM 3146 TaxID=3401092 RepID=UPI003B99A996